MRKRRRAFQAGIEHQDDCSLINKNISLVLGYLFLTVVSITVYSNSLACNFVFDDASAILDNQDLRSDISPLSTLFLNDFWGTPMAHDSSHKSYRPLTVLSYRWNYQFAGLNPWSYHLVNVLLHSLVVTIFYKFCGCFLNNYGAFAASFIFAVHPVHVEAVTGVVGRAELLSAVFALSSLCIYLRCHRRHSTVTSDIFHVLCVSGLLLVGTLCKEQCITVVAVCLAYDFVFHFIYTFYRWDSKRAEILSWWRFLFRGLLLLSAAAVFLIVRVRIMGSQLPHFTPFDNPAAHAAPLTRRLTHLYLLFVNSALLFFPSGLCADWTMGSVPLIDSPFDPRNALTLLTLLGILVIALRCAWSRTHPGQALTLAMGLALVVLPFIPASNLFFYVGFVVAERVLYVPSLGFCLIMGLGFQYFLSRCKSMFWNFSTRYIAILSFLLVCSAFSLKTFHRNYDWRDEYSLFTSALRVNPTNAKLWNNVGHALEARSNFEEALEYFSQAVRVQPNDMGARINVGRTLVQLGRHREAEEVYYRALEFFPKPKKGVVYHTRVSPKDLSIFINLANLLAKDESRLDEADALLRRAISLRADNVEAYQNRGSILVRQQRFAEAETMYRKALEFKYKSAALHYNLGVVLLEINRTSEAFACFQEALLYDPEHEQTKFALASSYSESGDVALVVVARRLFEELAVRDFEPVRVHFALAMMHSDIGNFTTAGKHYLNVLKADPSHRSSLFNLALMYHNELNDSLAAVPLLERLIAHHSDHFKSYMLLGDIALSVQKDPESAHMFFEKAISLSPSNLQARHNLCVTLVELGDSAAGERCLLEAVSYADPNSPKDAYVFRHLNMLQAKRRNG